MRTTQTLDMDTLMDFFDGKLHAKSVSLDNLH